jgi:hypothetical protein
MVCRILIRCLTGLVGAFIVGSFVSAQDVPPKTVQLPDGTPIHLYLKDDLDSKSSREGDPIRFQVREDVVVGNVVVIPAGSPAYGHVLAVGHRSVAGHSGRLSFSIDYVTAPDGTKVPVVSTPNISGGSNGKATAAATATYGPAALLMRGWNADIRRGTTLNAYVNGSHEIGMANLTVHPSYTLRADNPAPAMPGLQHRPNPPAVVPPAIVLVDPAVAKSGETLDLTTSPVVIRGATIDASGIPAVTINGTPAAMRPKGPQAAEFSSDPIELQPGENRFEIVATNAANVEARVVFTARFTPPTGPSAQRVTENNVRAFTKAQILDLLKGGVPSARVVELVKERGINFSPTEDDLTEIRAVGGGDELVDALRQAPARALR